VVTIKNFLSCDWGTSTFRLRAVQVPGLKIIAEESSADGIASCFGAWKQIEKDENTRVSFYLNILRKHIILLEKKLDVSLSEIK
jgi:2-dehydro-3-deoxygalactonokinase